MNWVVKAEAVDSPTPSGTTPVTSIEGLMVICVDISIKPECIDRFIEITCAHCASCSDSEDSGVVR
jgi:hypothetical protein